MRKFHDNSIAPIIAIDFDDTIAIGHGDGGYPNPGTIRPYACEVINFLTSIGVKVVIHSCRDMAIDQDKLSVIDDITPMVDWLRDHGVMYSAINKSVQFAPYAYNGRKIYAHMYVDDRSYGWKESDDIMLQVLKHFLINIVGIDNMLAGEAMAMIRNGYYKYNYRINRECRRYVNEWNARGK